MIQDIFHIHLLYTCCEKLSVSIQQPLQNVSIAHLTETELFLSILITNTHNGHRQNLNSWAVSVKCTHGYMFASKVKKINIIWQAHMSWIFPSQWRHNESDGVSNHQRLYCLFRGWFKRRSKKASKLRINALCEGNSPMTGELPVQRASNAENGSIW